MSRGVCGTVGSCRLDVEDGAWLQPPTRPLSATWCPGSTCRRTSALRSSGSACS